eukprot:g19125.t1
MSRSRSRYTAVTSTQGMLHLCVTQQLPAEIWPTFEAMKIDGRDQDQQAEILVTVFPMVSIHRLGRLQSNQIYTIVDT